MLYKGLARAVDDQYRIFDFDDWSALSPDGTDDKIGLVDRMIKIPRVIILLAYDKLPKRRIRFSRMNIFARDKNTCQYCGRSFPRSELNLDHVIPRYMGGVSTWTNVVCCCIRCNKLKGGRTPKQAGMKLLKQPRRPTWGDLYFGQPLQVQYEQWKPFLSFLDISYWYTELQR